jgi:hypothetical protein
VSVQQEGGNFPFSSSYFLASGTPTSMSDFMQYTPNSWTEIITPSSSRTYCSITPWGNLSATVYLDYASGKFTIDNTTKIAESDGLALYFTGFVVSGSTMTLLNLGTTYNSSTKTLDFSGTYNGLPVQVGIIAREGNSAMQVITYRNLKIVLTSTYSTPQSNPEVTKKAKTNAIEDIGIGVLLKNSEKFTITNVVDYSK